MTPRGTAGPTCQVTCASLAHGQSRSCHWWECLTEPMVSRGWLPCPTLCALLQVRRLYTGPQDDEIIGHAISCNSKGPLLIHIAKLFPKPDVSSFDAFGRIFSGTVKPGDKACAVTTTCS